MASTDLMTYLNYMATWDSESDANIDNIITEQNLFLRVGDYDSDTAVNNEFNTLDSLACEVRDLTIAADATQIAADTAAIASIWSFGIGMAAFAALEAAEIIEKKVISDKSKKLNDKLTTADSDISANINDNVKNYVAKYKENNNLIASKAPKGLDPRTCRSYLMQFTADVQRRAGKLDAATFKKYAESARLLYNSDEINKVYDALDELNLSDKTDADVKKFMNVLVGFQPPQGVVIAKDLLMGISMMIMFNKLKIANKTIATEAKAAGIPVEEYNVSAFEAMDAVGKFVAVVAVVMSVVDIIFNILDIVDVVNQCKKMCDELQGSIKQSYLDYFNGIKEASKKYNAAISPQSNWVEKENVAEYGGASWNNLITTIPSTTVEAAKQYADSNSNINFFFYCRGNLYLDANHNFAAGTAVFFSGTPWYGSAPQCDAYEKSN
jgi:gas vesicle protein